MRVSDDAEAGATFERMVRQADRAGNCRQATPHPSATYHSEALYSGNSGLSALYRTTYRGALDGLKILDLAGTIAAGYCGKLFADHGAQVLLAEPLEGFPTRRLPPFAPGVDSPEASGMHAYLSTNKRSVVCESPAALLTLARGAALVIDADTGGQRPLELDALARVSPDAVLLSITWFGQTGPYKNSQAPTGFAKRSRPRSTGSASPTRSR